jgi:hypothetical protein
MMLALVAASIMKEGESAVPWFARVELIDLLSWGCLAALVAIVLYRAYQEYYLPIQQERKLTALRERFEEESERAVDAANQAQDP